MPIAYPSNLLEIEHVIAHALLPVEAGAAIACFYTSLDFPEYSAPMPRVPLPKTGAKVDVDLVEVIRKAMVANVAIHDGAMMFGRARPQLDYRLTGWSFRLFPPNGQVSALPNRGSAYNTCLHMSLAPSVDFLFAVSKHERWRFANGKAVLIAT